MVKKLFEIIDDANDLREKIHKSVKTKKEVRYGEIAGWDDKILQLQADLAKKLDELFERFVRLEDEVRRKKTARAEAVPFYQATKKKAKHKRKKLW